ncbi:hypothetical protein PG995_008809 [Apiospora arundinis]|uniref:Carboxylic ester hydrolase n=1 Tax=Apiospora arundinis TaxID=335852 RepID=A0ABR2JMS2_9PEZI
MQSALLSLVALSHAAFVQAAPAAPSAGGLDVDTTTGNLHGFVDDKTPNVRRFLGIPFAEPPVGKLRWQPPQKAQHRGDVNATAYGPSCFQEMSGGTIYDFPPYSSFGYQGGAQSEDCLHLNVFSPTNATAESKLPVIIWIHGGGWVTDDTNVAYQVPELWVERTKGHIVVSVKYRLNLFGFPNAAAGTENYGLLDQRAGVEWVRDNIAKFGGDVNRMTLWGQSAGAASVAYWGYTYPEEPIVAGLIADSGAGHAVASVDTTGSNFTTVANLVGCYHMQPAEQLECMREVNPVYLSQAMANAVSAGENPASFFPAEDDKTVYKNMTDRISRGLVAKIPMIAGDNDNEAGSYVRTPPEGTLRLTPEEVQVGYDENNCPNAVEMNLRHQFGYDTYRYLYTGNFTNISRLPYIGAVHSAELPMIYGTHELHGPSTPFESEVSRTMQDLWLSFMSDPSKAPRSASGVEWMKYDPSTKSMLVFAKDEKVTQFADRSLVEDFCKK